MNNTKHGTTNFRMLKPFLDVLTAAADECGMSWRRFTADGYMDLSMEMLGYTDHKGRPVFYMAHFGEQNGDLMADPSMDFSVDFDAGTIEPLTFRNDYLGVFDQVYITRDGQQLYSKRLRSELDDFLWHWLQNIQEQGFSPAVTKATA